VTRATDGFWGLPPAGDGLHLPTGGARGVAQLRIEGELTELAAGAPVRVPGLSPVEGAPLVRAVAVDGAEVALAARRADGSVALAFDPDAVIAQLSSEVALTPRPPLSARLPFHYHRVPRRIRRGVRDALVLLRKRGDGRERFPSWPVEPSIEVLRAVYLRARQELDPALRPLSPWPGDKRFAIVLTHDIDSAEGQRVALELAAAERDYGLRSASYLVGRDWPLNHDALGSLLADGHELGLHDAHHDNRGAFMATELIGRRLDACRDLIERYDMTGYRSPSMLRTAQLYDALRSRFAYDSSMPDTGLLPKPNGCATVFPIEPCGVPMLPLTLPPDGQLVALGLGPSEVAERWIAKAEWVARAGGIAMVLTHPERGFSAEPPMQDAYRRFLAWAASREDAWHALPREVAARWAEHAASA
jgi:peptidoglycan/xylan/chitin deacetylase (PgdA/CDA1 family)